MFSTLSDSLTRNVEIQNHNIPVWQLGLLGTATFVISYSAIRKLTRPKYSSSTTAEEIMQGQDLSGRTIIVTGANTGLGKETSRQLVKAGARVILACRTEKKAKQAIQDIVNTFSDDEKNNITKNLIFMPLDLNDLSSVFDFAKTYTSTYDSLDILVNNAGVMAIQTYETTKQGFERQFGVNHMGHAYLTILLTKLLSKSKFGGRVINLSSSGHRATTINKDFNQIINSLKGPIKDNYKPFHNYGISKSSNILFTYEYNKRHYKKYNISSFSLHPGAIYTDLARHLNLVMMGFFMIIGPIIMKSVSQGISTTLRCITLTNEEVNMYNGLYFTQCQPAKYIKKPLFDPMNQYKLKEDHDLLHNKDLENITQQFYDWTFDTIKKEGFSLEI